MSQPYDDVVDETSKSIIEAVLKAEGGKLLEDPKGLDAIVRRILRRVGFQAVQGTFEQLVERLVEQVQKPGLVVQRRPVIEFGSVYGWVKVPSPYLRDKSKPGATARPVSSVWGLHHRGRTRAVERAMTDFGAEESFGQASKRFEERLHRL